MFLPEQSQGASPDGVTAVTPANPETTTEDIALMQRMLSAASRNPNLIPTDFMAYLVDYIQTSRLSIPIGQVFGFAPYAADIQSQQAQITADRIASEAAITAARVAAETAIANAAMQTYGDTSGSLFCPAGTPGSAAGPAVSGLPAGKYVILASFDSQGINGPQMVVSSGLTVTANPLEQLITFGSTTNITSTISGTGAGAGGTIFNCWILALKYSN